VAAITRSAEAPVYELDRGVNFRNLAVKEMGTETISVGLATFEPGAYLPCHTHNCEESITVLEGEAYVDVAGARSLVKPYDTSHVPTGVPHRFVNASRTAKMTILWVYASADVDRIIQPYARCMGDKPPEPGEEGPA
jgi:quercetin dioxygenase-like cupin family protein